MGKPRRNWRPLRPLPRKYYVYIWYRISDNHVFYVGKGTGDRVIRTGNSHRNKYFLNYINKYNCDYKILIDNLTEKEAYVKENDYYQYYKLSNECECNLSDTSSCNGGSGLKGELNGMYHKTHSILTCQKLSDINIEFNKTHSNSNAHTILAYNLKTKEYLIFTSRKQAMQYFHTNVEFFNDISEMSCFRIIGYSNQKHYSYHSWCFKDFPRDTKINEDNIVSNFIDYVGCRKTTYTSTHTYEEDVTTKEKQHSFRFKNNVEPSKVA